MGPVPEAWATRGEELIDYKGCVLVICCYCNKTQHFEIKIEEAFIWTLRLEISAQNLLVLER